MPILARRDFTTIEKFLLNGTAKWTLFSLDSQCAAKDKFKIKKNWNINDNGHKLFANKSWIIRYANRFMTIQHWQQQLYDRNRVRGGNLLCNSVLLYFLLFVQRMSRLLRFVYFLAFKVNERIILAMSAQWRLSEVISMNLNHENCDKSYKLNCWDFLFSSNTQIRFCTNFPHHFII